MIRAYKYKLRPTPRQIAFFEQSFGCARYVYNWALDVKIKAYQQDKTRLTSYDLQKMLTSLKRSEDHAWLREVSSQTLTQSIMNMDSAFTRFFREKKGFPKFKSKHHSRPSCKFIHPTTIRMDFDRHRLNLPKVGWVNLYLDRRFEGKIGTVTVSRSSTGEYWASVSVDTGVPVPAKPAVTSSTAVGIDVGIKDFAVLSDGTRYGNLRFLERSEKRLAVLQRRLSRKVRGSGRYARARHSVAVLHERVRNQRMDYLHKVSTRIIRENQTVIIEDLNIDGMLKNHCLARSISSVAWGEFFRMLEYKSEWYGVNLIRIGRFEPSSRLCTCGSVNQDLKLSDRVWTCPVCGATHDRDLLAACNIKRFGLDHQNLIGTPAVSGAEDVESSGLPGAENRQCLEVQTCK